MTLHQVMSYVNRLSKWDKLRLIRTLAGQFAHEEMLILGPPPRGKLNELLSAAPDFIPSPQPRENYGKRGQEIYERDIRPTLKPEDDGKYLVIDVETGIYEMDADERLCTARLYVRRPEGKQYLVRVGYRSAGVLGCTWESAREKPT